MRAIKEVNPLSENQTPKGGATNGSDGACRVSTPNRLRGKTSPGHYCRANRYCPGKVWGHSVSRRRTEVHRAPQWRKETADFADCGQIWGVLPHAGRRGRSLEVWRLGWRLHEVAPCHSGFARRPAGAFRSLFSVLCSPFSVLRGGRRPPLPRPLRVWLKPLRVSPRTL